MHGIPSLDGENKLVLSCPAEKTFEVSRIRSELKRLEDRVREHFGRRLVLQLLQDGAAAQTESHHDSIRRQVAPTDQEELVSACRDDEPLAGLVEMLDGEAVPSTETPEWVRKQTGSGGADSADRTT